MDYHNTKYSPAGIVKRSRSIIFSDVGITVSLSHKVSYYIEVSIPEIKTMSFLGAVDRHHFMRYSRADIVKRSHSIIVLDIWIKGILGLSRQASDYIKIPIPTQKNGIHCNEIAGYL